MIKQSKVELVVGIFTIIGLALLCFLIFFVSDFYLFKKGYNFKVRFDYISILDKGAPVRMSGVRVGEVKDVIMTYQEKTRKPIVTLDLYVNNDTIVRENTRILIQGTTPLSEPHIEIMSEGLRDGVPIEPGAIVQGIDPIPMEKLVTTANEIADKVKEVVTHTSEFFGDEKMKAALRSTLLHISTLTESLDSILTGEKESILESIDNFEKATANLEATLNHIREGKGTAGKIFLDDELYNEILAFVKDLKAHPWKLLAKPKDKGERGKFLFLF